MLKGIRANYKYWKSLEAADPTVGRVVACDIDTEI